MIELLLSPEAWIAFFTLTALELVLGIDNIIFISILVDRLPPATRERARRIGLFLALFMRISLLLLLAWLVGLTAPLVTILRQELSGRDIILILGGLFLLWKSTKEMHQAMEGDEPGHGGAGGVEAAFGAVITQIVIIDLVFSLDSIITAVGMVDEVPIMVAAVIVSVGLMMMFASPLGRYVSAHPTIKMLALAFLFLVGMTLVADGLGHHVPKGYIYCAMGFSVAVELLNLRARRRAGNPVQLRRRFAPAAPPPEPVAPERSETRVPRPTKRKRR